MYLRVDITEMVFQEIGIQFIYFSKCAFFLLKHTIYSIAAQRAGIQVNFYRMRLFVGHSA
jgi:hypothetical protein